MTTQGEENKSALPTVSFEVDLHVHSPSCEINRLINPITDFHNSVHFVHEPWDVLRGKDVFKESENLRTILVSANISHRVPNCATFSRAREIPIVGVKYRPQPLRDQSYPEGLPSLTRKQRVGVQKDTELADLAAINCLNVHRLGKLFSLEHTGRSVALHVPSWKKLCEEPGVIITFYHACMFAPCERQKYQILIHNMPNMVRFTKKTCGSKILCSRTNKRHKSFHPVVKLGKVKSWATGLERQYPRGFCSA